MIKARFNPHTIAINADNGPENNARRNQFMKRFVDFATQHEVGISLIYYPPYHSKYNPEVFPSFLDREVKALLIGKFILPVFWFGVADCGISFTLFEDAVKYRHILLLLSSPLMLLQCLIAHKKTIHSMPGNRFLIHIEQSLRHPTFRPK
jgi:hypothetical protein